MAQSISGVRCAFADACPTLSPSTNWVGRLRDSCASQARHKASRAGCGGLGKEEDRKEGRNLLYLRKVQGYRNYGSEHVCARFLFLLPFFCVARSPFCVFCFLSLLWFVAFSFSSISLSLSLFFFFLSLSLFSLTPRERTHKPTKMSNRPPEFRRWCRKRSEVTTQQTLRRFRTRSEQLGTRLRQASQPRCRARRRAEFMRTANFFCPFPVPSPSAHIHTESSLSTAEVLFSLF